MAVVPGAATAQTPPAAASVASPPPIVAPDPAASASTTVPAPPSLDDPVAQAIYARLQQMTPIQGGPLPRQDAALGKALSDFYMQRHYRAAWSDPDNVRQLLAGLASVDADGLLPEDYHLGELKAMVEAPDRVGDSPEQKASFEIAASGAYITALVQLARGKVDPVRLDPTWNFDPAAIDPQQGMSMLQTSIDERSVEHAFAMARPQNPLYARLRDALAQLRAAAAQGGWPAIPDGPTLKPGMKDPRVRALRTRMVAGGYLDPTLAHGEHFDNPLADAVKRFQADQYLDADGSVGAGTLASLNV
ncbi:MAG: peptidoglycan-binding protein, partial [Luteibacter sp.]